MTALSAITNTPQQIIINLYSDISGLKVRCNIYSRTGGKELPVTVVDEKQGVIQVQTGALSEGSYVLNILRVKDSKVLYSNTLVVSTAIDVAETITTFETEVTTGLENKVDKEEGKSLVLDTEILMINDIPEKADINLAIALAIAL
jgi:hypothetical protein